LRVIGNIVWCGQMCNFNKAARPYEWLILFLGQFLELHPMTRKTISVMARKFNAWLQRRGGGTHMAYLFVRGTQPRRRSRTRVSFLGQLCEC
jgi:hypothetical protein